MNSPSDNSARQRLLSAAEEIFAAKGFNRASVREICQAAGVNGAAINYYFGDKASLYREVLKPAAALTEIPQEMLAEDVDLRAGIEAYYRPLLAMARDPHMPLRYMLFMREQIQPSGLIGGECQDFFRPRFEQLRAFLIRHCGSQTAANAVNQLALSLIGMGMILFLKPDIVRAYAPDLMNSDAALEQTLQRLCDQAVALVKAQAGCQP